MAVTSAQVSVGTTAVALNSETGSVSGTRLIIKNTSGLTAVFLGDSSVTASTGFRVAAGDTVTVHAFHGDVIYAIGELLLEDAVHVVRFGD